MSTPTPSAAPGMRTGTSVATREEVLAAAAPLLACLADLAADDPVRARDALSAVDTAPLERLLRAGHAEGWLTPREGGGVRFGRLAKANPETRGYSIDVVDMDGPATGAHTHPLGEFDLCFALEGRPTFDGSAGPWLVYPPGSRHVPTVTGGRMLIVYFLPEGAIRFEG